MRDLSRHIGAYSSLRLRWEKLPRSQREAFVASIASIPTIYRKDAFLHRADEFIEICELFEIKVASATDSDKGAGNIISARYPKLVPPTEPIDGTTPVRRYAAPFLLWCSLYFPEVFNDYAKLVGWPERALGNREQSNSRSTLGLIVPKKMELAQNAHVANMRYSQKATDFVGRKAELERLTDFAKNDDQRTFKWWQIAGPAGQGKSRLALQFVERCVGEDWEAGFVLHFDDAFISKLENYAVQKPLLIVIDYASDPERAALLGKAIAALSVLDTPHQVRLLVLERQPYDGLFDPNYGASPERLATSWHHVLLANLELDAQPALDAVFDPRRALYLETMTIDQLKEIAAFWVASLYPGRSLTEDEFAAIASFLGANEPSSKNEASDRQARTSRRTPLFSMLAAEAVTNGCGPVLQYDESIYPLLDFALDHDAKLMFGKPHEARSLKGLALRVAPAQSELQAMCANVVGQIDMRELSDRWQDPDIDIVQRLLGYALASEGSHYSRVHAREPDVLAEYQVLRLVESATNYNSGGRSPRRNDVTDLLAFCWRHKPRATFSFLYRLIEDFPSHPSTLFLLQQRPAIESVRLWMMLLSYIPEIAYHELGAEACVLLAENCAEAGDAYAINQYLTGLSAYVIALARNHEFRRAEDQFHVLESVLSQNLAPKTIYSLLNASFWMVFVSYDAGDLAKCNSYHQKAVEYWKNTFRDRLFGEMETVIEKQYTFSLYLLSDILAEYQKLNLAELRFFSADQNSLYLDDSHVRLARVRASCSLALQGSSTESLDTATRFLAMTMEAFYTISHANDLIPRMASACISVGREALSRGLDSIEQALTAFTFAEKLFDQDETFLVEGKSFTLRSEEVQAIRRYFVLFGLEIVFLIGKLRAELNSEKLNDLYLGVYETIKKFVFLWGEEEIDDIYSEELSELYRHFEYVEAIELSNMTLNDLSRLAEVSDNSSVRARFKKLEDRLKP
ncbi:MAG TPA: ATP-binding protein [Planctomycetes bacterium]|uniref:hypothetical protein n=1 Tax=Henriciella sp. TaxID=1968823 RepID=UPI001807FB4E|nr:hypothetical protein [Henriciella sp.]HIG21766.1 ATP-binding protein [Henriciella sp.]HIM29286.1 ATP-binding protein [Planctomycetota bacterium]